MEGNRPGWAVLDVVAGSLARVFDICWVFIAAVLAYWIRFDHVEIPLPFQAVMLIGALLVMVYSSGFSVYASWRGRRKIHLLGRLCTSYIVTWATIMGLLAVTHQADYFSRLWLGFWFLTALLGSVLFRAVVYFSLSRMRARGHNTKRVVIVGSLRSIDKAHRRLIESPWLGLTLHKALVVRRESPIGDDKCALPCEAMESLTNLNRTVNEDRINEVWICLPLREEERVNEVLYELRHSTVNIRYFPDLSGYRLLNHRATEVAGLYALDLSCSPLDGLNRFVKNLEDRLLGLFIFLVITPLLLLIAVGVKLSSPGPVIFKQYRHGIDGRRINVYKFRSMKIHNEPNGRVTQASRLDDRVTAFGRFLRKTSLDELPQFFNVIQGKMSIVGPRPHAMAHNEQYKELVESYMKRHKVKPGITGWAQVNGLRGETDTVEKMRKRVEYDLFYIENWSLAFDLRIIALTLWKGFFNKNAF
jgi:putative colanic acid biosynthesis UDP-glucose lipid carrier transferase